MKSRTFLILLAAGTLTLSGHAKTSGKSHQVIYTGDIARQVTGYAGATPVNIIIDHNKITKIEVLPNNESPNYLKRAVAKVLPQFEGKTVEQAKKVKADAATGATYTSQALIKNITMGLQQAKSQSTSKKSNKKRK